MNDAFEIFIVPLFILLAALISIGILCLLVYLIHFLLTAPMRRAGRARFFLNLVDTALDRGLPLEETLISAARTRDRTLGSRFQTLAAVLGNGRRLADALAMVPRFMPRQIVTMFQVGEKIGDLRKILPACRQLLRDAISETRSAMNYVVVIAFVVTPFSMFVLMFLSVKIVPALFAISEGVTAEPPTFAAVIWHNTSTILLIQAFIILSLWTFAFLYAVGPRAAEWFPILHRIYFWLPWRRKRMVRDFSSMLALLLDAGVPEADAVQLAASCTDNAVFVKRADEVVDELKRGVKLTDAIQGVEGTGEFTWRIRNAAHVTNGFNNALNGLHEALDAKAFQQEQAAAHTITTTLVLLNGVFVGAIVTSVFTFLVSIINAGALW